ncbi:MAG: hypothetical protein FJ243_00355 [Nitrospira sp.]|nr:hypothetical protein [Nitrospira sp.]
MNNQRIIWMLGALALVLVVLSTITGIGAQVFRGTIGLIGKVAGIIILTLLVYLAVKNIKKRRP